MTSHAEMKADKIDQWLPIPISGANLLKWCWCYSYITPLCVHPMALYFYEICFSLLCTSFYEAALNRICLHVAL